MVMDVCCSVKEHVKFNHVWWGQMPYAICRWCSCVVVLVCELRSPSISDFLEGLENSGWLKHIKAVLDAAIFIAKVSLGVNPRCLPHHCSQYWLRCVSECVRVCVCMEAGYEVRQDSSPAVFPLCYPPWSKWGGQNNTKLTALWKF